MLLFGHVGIATGVVRTFENIVVGRNDKDKNKNIIDYRVVMLGALLPDIIDKPIVEIVYGLRTHEGHLFAHTFIFSGLLIVIGTIYFLINKNKNVFLLGICSLLHQLMDRMVLLPNIFSLPVFGVGSSIIPRHLDFIHKITAAVYNAVPYFEDVKMYFLEPYVYIPEVIGFLVLFYFVCKLIIIKKFKGFLKYGRL